MQIPIKQNRVRLGIGLVWLFHITAIIGISMGELHWFIEKTPFNILLCALLFLWIFPINNLKKGILFLLFFLGGMVAEALGVNYSILFGSYSYGANFGPKIAGVPYLIGVNWAILTFITASTTSYLIKNKGFKMVLAASLMVLLDFFMEGNAPIFDFWEFDGGIAPLFNYITWFVIALLFQIILHTAKITGNKEFSAHLYFSQLAFFAYFLLFPI